MVFFFLALFEIILDYGPEGCHNCSSNNWRENSEDVGEPKKQVLFAISFSFFLIAFLNTFITSTLVMH